jgi:GNAT superfamily N-acetyltransferase
MGVSQPVESLALPAQTRIRRYEKPDQAQVWNLHVLAIQAISSSLYVSGAWEADLLDIPRNYLENGGEFLVGELNGQIIVMGAFRRISDTCAEIKRMRVHPDYWRQGLGQAMLTRLEQIAKAKGYTSLVLDTTIHQPAAQALYLKNNYTETRREKLGSFDLIFYEKQL